MMKHILFVGATILLFVWGLVTNHRD